MHGNLTNGALIVKLSSILVLGIQTDYHAVMPKRLFISIGTLPLLLLFVISANSQGEIYAEPYGQANLRAQDFLESQKVGEINVGERYIILGRSSRFPWLLLGDVNTRQPIGWVYQELVQIFGDESRLPYSDITLGAIPSLVPTGNHTPNPSSAVTGLVIGEINLRSGPGINYPRLGVARAGERYEVIAVHAQFPWLQISSASLPGGTAWVAENLLEIEGDLSRLPRETQLVYATPELTATPAVVRIPQEARTTSPEIQALGEEVWQLFLDAGFDFQTQSIGAIYFFDLLSATAFQFGEEIAFSGTSLTKIAILVELFRQLNFPPNSELSLNIAHTMICSDNRATNELLAIIGQGDELTGALRVTDTLRQLGLLGSYISAPYAIPGEVLPSAALPIQTIADQDRVATDPYNQATVSDLGQLMRGIYDCARDESGLFEETFPGQLDRRECRSMMQVMAANTVDSLLVSGVPESVRVAHKHGWISDTHGNVALFFTPSSHYVLVMMLYKPQRLDFINDSLPLFAEASRLIYNHLNPTEPLAEVRPSRIPALSECDFRNTTLVGDLQAAGAPFPP